MSARANPPAPLRRAARRVERAAAADRAGAPPAAAAEAEAALRSGTRGGVGEGGSNAPSRAQIRGAGRSAAAGRGRLRWPAGADAGRQPAGQGARARASGRPRLAGASEEATTRKGRGEAGCCWPIGCEPPGEKEAGRQQDDELMTTRWILL